MALPENKFLSPCLALIFSALVFSSCSTAKEAAPSGFLDDYAGLKQGAYFKQQAITPGTDFTKFRAVKVAPVNLSHLDDKTACDTGELENLAREFREDIEGRLKEQGLTVTSSPGPDTLILSVALTNVEPPEGLLNAGLTAVSMMTMVPASIFDKDGKTSLEGRVIDGGTGRELIRLAEERTGSGDELDVKAMTVGNYQKFTNTQTVFSGWAKTLAEMLKDLTSGVDPAAKNQAGKKGKATAKQLVGFAV